ncbi:MAG: hypothetical protein KDC52_03450, partial [Ignavibacteriae bacterium]|nr:hypothetical protein [Ignavibacteriota bacterium]
MIQKYITAILRDQFNLFFRYGFTDIPSVLTMNVDSEIDKSILEIFSRLTPFYDESHYIILEFETTLDLSKEQILKIEIQDLVKIYPLSKLASATIKQSRIDSRIKIEEPKFEHLLFDIELMFRRKNLLRSVKALWKICDIESEPDELFNKIGIDNLLKGIEYRKKGLKANMIREGNYWSYLIAYDSYNLNFPSSTLGHFYDAGEVFAYSNNQETFVGSKYYNFLESLNAKNPNLTLQEIIKYLEISDEISAYRNKATNNELKEYLISPIFLLLKEDLRKESELSKTKLNKKDYLLKVGGENFKAALVLLAAFFGFDKFYDAYYDKMNLRFFTAFRETKPSKKEEENRQEMVKKEIPKEKVEESISAANVLSLTINPVEMKTVSEPVNDYHQIILSALKSKGSCSLTDLAKELKAKKGKGKITKEDVRLILKDLEGIE